MGTDRDIAFADISGGMTGMGAALCRSAMTSSSKIACPELLDSRPPLTEPLRWMVKLIVATPVILRAWAPWGYFLFRSSFFRTWD